MWVWKLHVTVLDTAQEVIPGILYGVIPLKVLKRFQVLPVPSFGISTSTNL